MGALIDAVPLTIVTNVTTDMSASWLGVAIALVYFVAFEGSKRGQTPGKMIVKVRVVDAAAGGSIGYGRALVRHGGRAVSAAALALGYLWMLWDRDKQTWHDKLSESVVKLVRGE